MKTTVIFDVVERAWRRCVWNEALSEGVLAACLAAGGAIAILLAGSQLLDWTWLAALAVVSLGTGAWRASRRLPTRYRVAQIVDNRMALSDALSTSLYFLQSGTRGVSEGVCEVQRAGAEQLAAQVDPAAAVPLLAPRRVYTLAILALIAAGLFTLRYGLEGRLDLRAPLTVVLTDAFGGGAGARAAASKKKGQKRLPWDQPAPMGVAIDETTAEEQAKLDAAPDSVLDTVDTPDVNPDENAVERKEGKSPGKGEGSEQTEPGEEGAEPAGDQSNANNADGERTGNQQKADSSGKQPPESAGENASLAAKLRDAMANLMSRMRPRNAAGANRPSPDGKGAQSPSQQTGAGQKSSAGQADKQSGGDQSADARDGQAGDEGKNGQNADGQSSGRSSEEQASNTPGSGMGKQDGAKEVKLAEQLAAMGKISEIIGKRSAQVTGEVSVEVQSTKQQLRTPYADSRAAHTQASGEINRDEVPAVFQEYVQQYFERVRKPVPPAAAGQPPASEPPAPKPTLPPRSSR